MNPILEIAELFPTIQGEGVLTGEPSIFVRTQGCSFGCNFCDTKYSWPKVVMRDVEAQATASKLLHCSTGYTPRELSDAVKTLARVHNCKALVLTGGEPFEQEHGLLGDFLVTIREYFKHITIETAAFVPLKDFSPVILTLVDVLSISPKLPRFLRDAEVNISEKAYYTAVVNYIRKFELVRRTGSRLGLKFVITQSLKGEAVEELDWVLSWLQHLADENLDLNHVVLTLQPNGYASDGTPREAFDMLEDIHWLVDQCIIGPAQPIDNRWYSLRQLGLDIRILPQLHRLVWGTKMGV